MTIQSRFFGTLDTPLQYTQAELAEVLSRFARTGVYPGVDNEFNVTETDPPAMAVKIDTGQANINGYWVGNKDSAETLAVDPADASLPRIDRVILKADVINMTVTLLIKKGTAQISPVAPDLTRTAQVYEISLKQVYVGAGVTSINNANLTDERWDNLACGYAVPPSLLTHLHDGLTSAKLPVWYNSDVFYGSNANGYYIRFPNGLQICYGKINIPLSNSKSGNGTWTYPSEFLQGAEIEVVGNATAAVFNVSTAPGAIVTDVAVEHIHGTLITATATVRLMAIGRYE